MLNNDPRIRAIIYWVTVALGLGAAALVELPWAWAAAVGASLTAIVAKLAIITGATAGTNMTAGGDVKTLPPR